MYNNYKIKLSVVENDDINYFLDYLIKNMPKKLEMQDAIDICGTGGSGLVRINTSTISAFILASMGVKVAKHGNKAASGRFGSFDLLESLGIPINLDKEQLEELFKNKDLAFIYARKFHPIMKEFAEIRKKLGVPTVFNILGPLLNPANTKKQIIGTAFKDKMNLMAETCLKLGKKHVFIVSGEDGLDEVTITGKTYVCEVKNGKISNYTLSPQDFGIKKCKLNEIQSNDKSIISTILKGECTSKHLDLILVNCALGLKLVNKNINLKSAVKKVKLHLESGKAYEFYKKYKNDANKINLLNDIIENKKIEVEKEKKRKKFINIFKKNELAIIGEIKFASPTVGKIFETKNIKQLVKKYEMLGVKAISVLTDKKYFDGSYEIMRKVKSYTNLPILCKEFVIDKYQIQKAKIFGASAILLITKILSNNQIFELMKEARRLNLDSIVEVSSEIDLKRALKLNPEIVQINNRNLSTFKIDRKTTHKLIQQVPKNIKIICASGYSNENQAPKGINALLVGTSLMKGNFKFNTKVKMCGIRTLEQAKFCKKLKIDLIGQIFVSKSHRKVDIRLINKMPNNIFKVGVFQNQPAQYINTISLEANLDMVQLSGDESPGFCKKITLPIIKGINVKTKKDVENARKYLPVVQYILFDASRPGKGKTFNHKLLEDFDFPYFLAGGININNITKILNDINPFGVDVASGIENNSKISLKKINQINNEVKKFNAK